MLYFLVSYLYLTAILPPRPHRSLKTFLIIDHRREDCSNDAAQIRLLFLAKARRKKRVGGGARAEFAARISELVPK